MPRVHFVKKARKDNPVCKAGESYYWWKFRYGGKRFSLTHPKASQLTQSEFLGQMYELTEQLEGLQPEDVDELKSDVEMIIDEIRSLGSEQGDKRYNMPDSLQDSDTGMLLESRESECDAWASDLESIDYSVDEEPDDWDEKVDGEFEPDRSLQDVLDEVQACDYNGE